MRPLRRLAPAAAALVFAATAAGAEPPPSRLDTLVSPEAPFDLVVRKQGPALEVVEFRLPASGDPRLPEQPDAFNAVVTAMTERADAKASKAARDQMLKYFGLSHAGTGSASTFGQQALFIDRLENANGAFTNIGLGLALLQVGANAWAGEKDAAATNAYKGAQSFVIGKWGARSLQISAIAITAIDIALSEFGAEAWATTEAKWAEAYNSYYVASDKRRTIEDWRPIVHALFDRAIAGQPPGAPDPGAFDRLFKEALRDYARLFWRDVSIVGAEKLPRHLGGLNDALKKRIEDAHIARIGPMIAKAVFPEIAKRAWREEAKKHLWKLNLQAVEELNVKLALDVVVFGLEAPATVEIPLPSGGVWRAKLDPATGGFRTLEITTFAYMRAGYPDTVRLKGGGQSARFRFRDGRAAVTLGEPKTPIVAEWRVQETRAVCSMTRREASEATVVERPEWRDAPAPYTLFSAVLPPNRMIVGRYDPDSGWRAPSVGLFGPGGSVSTFSAPYFDDIRSFLDCGGTMDLEGGDLLNWSCRFERFEAKEVRAGVTLERRCRSQAEARLQAIVAAVGEGTPQRFASDTPAGRAVISIMRQGLQRTERN